MKLDTTTIYWNIVEGAYQWHNISPIIASNDLCTHSLMCLDDKVLSDFTSKIVSALEIRFPYWFFACSTNILKTHIVSRVPLIKNEQEIKDFIGSDGFFLTTSNENYFHFPFIKKLHKPVYEKVGDRFTYPSTMIFATDSDTISLEEYHSIIFQVNDRYCLHPDMSLLFNKIPSSLVYNVSGDEETFWVTEFFTTSQSDAVLFEILTKFELIQVSREEYSEMYSNTFSRLRSS